MPFFDNFHSFEGVICWKFAWSRLLEPKLYLYPKYYKVWILKWILGQFLDMFMGNAKLMFALTDYGRLKKKSRSLHGRKFNPNPKFLGTAEAYFVCHIGPLFQISLIYAFIGCP